MPTLLQSAVGTECANTVPTLERDPCPGLGGWLVLVTGKVVVGQDVAYFEF